MRAALETACLALFLLVMILPGVYGVHLYALMLLARRKLRPTRARQQRIIERYVRRTPEDRWPLVTTQIPIYNELAVARRVIEAAARMDYPAGRHEVQVLDDSTDATRQIVDEVCARLRAEGHRVAVLRRGTREHYKAGALAYGLRYAQGEFIAVFDADFLPQRGFLRRMIPLIASRPDAGCVQARWGHLNHDQCWITDGLSLGLDGHFGVEQGARSWNGFLLNFNGTGGIWRRATIEDPRVGGWQADTLTEDLDLSYRAQLAGWKVIYCIDEVCPAELPADVNAMKSQQFRWAAGSTQTARKLLPCVWRSRLNWKQKLEATLHLTQYSVALFMVIMPLLGRPLLAAIPGDVQQPWLAIGSVFVLIATAAPSVAYCYGRRVIGGGWSGVRSIPKLILLGLGLCINNCAAVLCGLLRRGGEFVRTPKSGSLGSQPRACPYRATRSRLWILEILLGLFCLAQWIYYLPRDGYVGGTYLLLYAVGLLALGWGSRPQLFRSSHPPARLALVAGT